MHRKHDEDLFKDTTMTFGEHLEELRVCLFKAVAGLVLGTIVGLFIGDRVVHLIERPLGNALGNYYQFNALEDYKSWAHQREAAGERVYYSYKDPPNGTSEIRDLIYNQRLIYDISYVHPWQILGALHEVDAGAAAPSSAAGDGTADKQEDAAHDEPTGSPAASAAPLKLGQLPGKGHLVPYFLWHPIDTDRRIEPTALGVTESFSIWMKASLVVGIVLSSPWVFYQIWTFVAAGLYPHEKKYVHVFLPFSLGLFLLGAATAYLFVFEPVLNFLLSFNRWLKMGPDPRISEWMSFVIFLPLGFGISFQLPLVMLFLERIGVFNLQSYLEKWRIAVLVIFILSAVLTPADPYSIFLMAVPLTLLYFGGMMLCRWMPRRTAAAEA